MKISGRNSLPLERREAKLKWLEDRALATMLLLFFLPLLLLIVILIKLDGSGPVFSRAQFIFENKIIEVINFRIMCADRAAQLPRNGPVTRVGCFLRASSLDQLPQLLNVINGTLSLRTALALLLVQDRAAARTR